MQTKTLRDAVLDAAIKHFLSIGAVFSAYEITSILRKDVNDKKYLIKEYEGVPSQHAQEINHSDVRAMVTNLHIEQFIDRAPWNGKFMQYSVGKVDPKNAIYSGDPILAKLRKLLHNHTDIAEDLILPSSLVMENLGCDDLDVVELLIDVEETFNIEIESTELPFDQQQHQNTDFTVATLVNLVKSKMKPAKAVTQQTRPTPSTNSVQLDIRMRDDLLDYLSRRAKVGVSPTLRSAQKAIKKPGTSVREIAALAKSLGYKVEGDSVTPFNQWVIV